MQILRKYETETAWYALVQMPDGGSVEFKIFSEAEPADAKFLALAEAYWEAEQARLNPETTMIVECEDGFSV